jgi:hypothetical protein
MNQNSDLSAVGDLHPVIFRNGDNASVYHLVRPPSLIPELRGRGRVRDRTRIRRASERIKRCAVCAICFMAIFEQQIDRCQRPEIRGGSTSRVPCGANTPAQAPQASEGSPEVLPGISSGSRDIIGNGEIASRLAPSPSSRSLMAIPRKERGRRAMGSGSAGWRSGNFSQHTFRKSLFSPGLAGPDSGPLDLTNRNLSEGMKRAKKWKRPPH